MPATYTPIRYPGGKTKLYSFVRKILLDNDLIGGTYCEPFAGGAGLAVKLLLLGDVSQIVINDADPAIYSIWNLIINNPDDICDFIETTEITIEEWERQKCIYLENYNNPGRELGKAAFFLNRTNISGVITGGVIGGKDQSGSFKLNARFNREALVKKIKRITAQKDKILLYNMDVFEFMDEIVPTFGEKTLINFDPPYVKKGNKLYKNSFTDKEHTALRDSIKKCKYNWIVTYDLCDLIKTLYEDYAGGIIDVYYSAKDVRKAKEYVFYSDGLVVELH